MRKLAICALAMLLGCEAARPTSATPPPFQSAEPLIPPTPRTIFADESDAAAWDKLASRSLVLQALAAEQPCPRSTSVRKTAYYAPLLGEGPIYPTLAAEYVSLSSWGREQGGYAWTKVLWVSEPGYTGPAIVRAARLDGTGEARFDAGRGPDPMLRFPTETGVRSAGTSAGWRDLPSTVGLSTPGCWAFQVDGSTFTSTVVIHVKP